MMISKMPGDAPQIHAVHIHLHSLLAHLIRIAMLFGLRSVLATTMHAAVLCEPDWVLPALFRRVVC